MTEIQFRDPNGRGVYVAALALAPRVGSLLVFDDIDTVFVVSADDDPSQVAERWLLLMEGPHQSGRTGSMSSGE